MLFTFYEPSLVGSYFLFRRINAIKTSRGYVYGMNPRDGIWLK